LSKHEKGGNKMEKKKVGIIRCQQAEDLCPGTTCFKVALNGKKAFESIGPVEIVGFVTCGGCPGKLVVPRAKMMVQRGAEIIILASCISKGNPIGYPCPFFEKIKDVLRQALDEKITILEYTH
jgi:predicted metal-binding protein